MQDWFVIMAMANAIWGNGEVDERIEFRLVYHGTADQCRARAAKLEEYDRANYIIKDPKDPLYANAVSASNPRLKGGVRAIADQATVCIPFDSPGQIKAKLVRQWGSMGALNANDEIIEWWGPNPEKVMK